MSNTIENVTTFSGKVKPVRAGHHQKNFVAGEVVRFSADAKADICEVANIDATTKESIVLTMAELLRCFNSVHKVNLKISDYDFQSGKYSRSTPTATPQAETPAQAVTPAQTEVVIPAIEVPADTTPATPKVPEVKISDALITWIKANYKNQL